MIKTIKQQNSAAMNSLHSFGWRRAGVICFGISSKTSVILSMPVGSVTIEQLPSDYRLFDDR